MIHIFLNWKATPKDVQELERQGLRGFKFDEHSMSFTADMTEKEVRKLFKKFDCLQSFDIIIKGGKNGQREKTSNRRV